MSECRRSNRLQKRREKQQDSDYVCACGGQNLGANTVFAECQSCGYLCCKNCICKRFDISSERKYRNVTNGNFSCATCAHNPHQPALKKRKVKIDNEIEEMSVNGIQMTETRTISGDDVIELYDRMLVLKYSKQKLKQTEELYTDQIEERKIAISKIKKKNYYDNEQTKKEKLWSHFISKNILKIIFMQCSTDKSVLNIIKVCKHWREVIIENENDEQFHQWLWIECVKEFGDSKRFEWKHLVLIPEKYLKLKRNFCSLQTMNYDERIAYVTLVGEENGQEYGAETYTNIPLLIQIIYKCPDIYSIEFRGLICEDIFVVMGTKCKNLTHLRFVFCDDGHYDWFGYLIPHDCMVRDTLRTIHIERSDWINGTACLYFAGLENLAGITSENWYISGFGMYLLLDKCVNLEYFHICIDEYDSDEYWVEAFEALSRKNKSICSIEFIMSAIGFNDECLSYLMDDEACPKLENLRLDFHSCSKEMIAKFKKKRPDVKVQENPLEY
eukprot:103385_1